MIRRVLIEENAVSDLTEAYQWIASEAPESAARWLDRLESAIGSLDEHAERCPLAPENEFFTTEIRQLLVGNYRVLFTVRARAVHILHVRHAARRALGEEDV